MTSASELFYNRRSRFGRNSLSIFESPPEFGSSPPHIDRTTRRSRHSQHSSSSGGGSNSTRGRADLEGCDPVRRWNRHRHSDPPQEHDQIRHDQGIRQSSSGNASQSGNNGNVRDRLGSNSNDRLPGAVLLARERLVQRLRGVTLSGNRRNNRTRQNSLTVGDDFRLVDAGDWDTAFSRELLAEYSPFSDPINPESNKRPPGLTQDELTCLSTEVFSENDELTTSRASRECSICLEYFCNGDELVRLPCGHRYHFCCLDPWVRNCGDCPYCRRGIVVTSDRVI